MEISFDSDALRKDETDLHWLSVNEDTVKGASSLGGAISSCEEDVGDTAADSGWAVGDFDSLDWTGGLGEVLLLLRIRISFLVVISCVSWLRFDECECGLISSSSSTRNNTRLRANTKQRRSRQCRAGNVEMTVPSSQS